MRAHTRERNERGVCVLCGGSAHLRPLVAAHERVRWGMDSSFPLGGDPYREAGAARISTMPLILMDLLSITSSAPSTNPIYRLAVGKNLSLRFCSFTSILFALRKVNILTLNTR